MSYKQVLSKLDSIQKEQKKSSALSNAAFGLALIAITISVLQNTTRLEIIIMSAILGGIGLAGFVWNITKWRLAERRKE
jgi:uncharacterized membrane protein YjjP (DUF1212 family)